jgi:hypothetical protein
MLKKAVRKRAAFFVFFGVGKISKEKMLLAATAKMVLLSRVV